MKQDQIGQIEIEQEVCRLRLKKNYKVIKCKNLNSIVKTFSFDKKKARQKHFSCKYAYTLKGNRQEKIQQTNANEKKTGMAILIGQTSVQGMQPGIKRNYL